VKFPGGRLLHGWDLAIQRLSLDDLLRSCRQVGLTGFAEIKLASGAGMILYYKGSEVSAVFRGDDSGRQGQTALERMRAAMSSDEGQVSIFELPLEMAHLLRGITNRRRLPTPPIRVPADLEKLLDKLRHDEHTGTLEVQTDSGSAAILLVNGRLSNMYWEGIDGKTLEKQPALVGLQQGLMGDDALVFLADFSREVWKSRHEVSDATPERLDGAGPALGASTVVDAETRIRADLLKDIDSGLPSMVQALVCDLMTGTVLARRIRGAAAIAAMQLVDRLPGLAMQLRSAHVADGNDIEVVEIEGLRTSSVIVYIADHYEAVAVVADNRQPTAQVATVVRRLVRDYVALARKIRKN
jgi:hypothetical protein